jgi:endonuclease G
MFSYLTRERINQIKDFFVTTLTAYDREVRPLLLNGIDPRFAGSLRNYPNNDFQLTGDLNTLNSVERLADGSVPLEIWLRNAVELLSHLDTGKVLSRALDDVTSRMSNAAPIEEPSTVPNLFQVQEAIVNRDDMVAYGFLQAGFEAGRSVARLQVPRHDNGAIRQRASGGTEIYLGTGWLVAPDLVITNHHVVNARSDGEADAASVDLDLQARNTTVQFDFDASTAAGESFRATKLEAFDPGLDYAVLRLASPPARTPLAINPPQIEIAKDSYVAVNIIQHPNGGPKKVALRNNLIYESKFPRLRYFTDTEHGSSGSPVFDDNWKVVALHRASTFVDRVQFQGRATGWVNEGTQMAAILDHVKTDNADVYNAIVGGNGRR